MEMLNVKEIQSPEVFTDMLRTYGMYLPVEESMAELRKPINVGEKTIPNRICIQPLEGWFDLAGFGRQALAYPEFARKALIGQTPDPARCCILCNSCFKLMYPGLSAAGCVVRDPDPYSSLYRKNVLGKGNGQ